MQLEIFDVEHGACALLTADNGTRLMIDCGHNATTGWKPGTYLINKGIRYLDMLAITNYDEDHASGLPNLIANVDIGWLWRNKSVTPQTITTLKSEYGMGKGIETLVNMASNYCGGGSTASPDFTGVERQCFYNNYPSFDDENNLSMVVFLKCNGINFLFPGDIECAGWLKLLQDDPSFRRAVAETTVLIASHHGRENGICQEIFDVHGCKPQLIIISDDYHQYNTQKTVNYYASKARGIENFRGYPRTVLTTRKDGDITFNFNQGSCSVY